MIARLHVSERDFVFMEKTVNLKSYDSSLSMEKAQGIRHSLAHARTLILSKSLLIAFSIY